MVFSSVKSCKDGKRGELVHVVAPKAAEIVNCGLMHRFGLDTSAVNSWSCISHCYTELAEVFETL